ncbi:MAG: NAD-dependent epimerase/dehydratase family protein, partial [Winogradskyella sp.]|nr:NAD-dependent epimerase/dehydratase family protein [Winogradskyella sp.]
MKQINVAISCAGSGIAHSIIDSCKISSLPLKLFALDSNPYAYGLYECDESILVPSLKEHNYLDSILKVCKDHNIDVIFPGIDDEVNLFSSKLTEFNEIGVQIIVSDLNFMEITRDKVKANNLLSEYSDCFVKSYYSVSDFLIDVENNKVNFPVIAKPNGGSGSMGVQIINSTDDLKSVNNNYIIQELALPSTNDANFFKYKEALSQGVNFQTSEISIQLVTNSNGDLIGKMASKNKLKNGIPIEIVPIDDARIWKSIDDLLPVLKKLGLKGPLNLQGRITNNGLKIFELNARFTGISGLRAQMGFNEVEACILNWLDFDYISPLEINKNKIGLRQTLNKVLDRSLLVTKEQETSHFNQTNDSKEILLITGATGFIGRNLISYIDQQKLPFKIWALVRDKKKAEAILPESLIIYDNKDLLSGTLSLGLVDTLVHLGFARPFKTNSEIANSLSFTADLLNKAVSNSVNQIINISSQSVYGQEQKPPWNEKTPVAPQLVYSTAKYATETILSQLKSNEKQLNCCSLRLASTIGGFNGLKNTDIISKLVKQVKSDEDLTIFGGHQIVERIDLRDA